MEYYGGSTENFTGSLGALALVCGHQGAVSSPQTCSLFFKVARACYVYNCDLRPVRKDSDLLPLKPAPLRL